MTTNPKPLLTRAELEGLRDYVWSPPIINTIERMAELLEQWLQVNQVSSHGVVKATHDLLKTFNATGGEGS